jgi:branched-chain amino acid transport system substrate-binding protein
VVSQIFTPLGSSDFASAVAQIAGADVDAVFGFLSGSDGVIFVQQYDAAGLKESKPLTVTGFMVDADVIDAVGQSAVGAISSMHYAPTLDNEVNSDFAPAFTETVQGYDSAQLIVKAIEATNGDTSPQALVDAMERAELDSPRGPVSIDPESHQIVQHMYVRRVEEVDGQLTNVVLEDLGEIGPAPLG